MYGRWGKRILDLVVSVTALVLLWPAVLLIAVLIRIKLGKPVLFSQLRPGLNGKLFRLYKFRTMTDKRDESGELLPAKERTTRFGSMLRSTSLDELPEIFINVIKGDMSLIGPRPLDEKYLPYYTNEEFRRHDVLPGLTGLAQVCGRNNLIWEKRFAYDLKYVDELSFRLDIYIFWRTIVKIIRRTDIIDTREGTELNFDVYRERQQAERTRRV